MREILSVLALGAAAMLAGCDTTTGPFRPTADLQAECGVALDLKARNQERIETGLSGGYSEAQLRCALQQHLLPGALRKRMEAALALAEAAAAEAGAEGDVLADPAPVEMKMEQPDWSLAAPALRHADTYFLSFIEMDDKGALHRPEQLTQLNAHLRARSAAGSENYVITFVHGWRHNADLRDGDVRKFRRMLGYARSALNSRCVEQGRYCNATLTGAFVGWNGAVFDEGPSDINPDKGAPTGPAALGPVLTFENRWNTSCKLGSGRDTCDQPKPKAASPLRKVLKRIEASLGRRSSAPGGDKMLIVGHSMGGNMLATMLREDAVKKAATHPKGRVMKPLIGDLAVLLNPAAMAEEWTDIQKAERERAGFTESNHRISCLNPDGTVDEACPDAAKLSTWNTLYPVAQRPIYVSLTSTPDWGTLADGGRTVEDDTATSTIFQLARLMAGQTDPKKKVAIGHDLPNYRNRFDVTHASGTTHELAVLRGAITDDKRRFRSRYKNTLDMEAAWCAPGDGWLRLARVPEPERPLRSWDYGWIPPIPGAPRLSSRNVGGRFNTAAFQWRQAMYPKPNSNTRYLSVAPWTTPFWNVRALDTAIRNHAGWANYATWCALHQLVLDDVTAQTPAAQPQYWHDQVAAYRAWQTDQIARVAAAADTPAE